MNFDFTDDQQAIKRTANELLGARFKPERVRELAEAGSYDDDAWKEMSELGWAGIFIDEEHGGQGLGIVELAILMEELGYALAPVPFLSNAAAGLALQFAGTDEQKQRWLPGIASGEARGTVGMLRDGEARLVPDADSAEVIVLISSDGSTTVVESSAADIEPFETMDRTRRFARVRVDGGESLGGDCFAAGDRIATALSAETVGVAQKAMEMAVEYARERKQFGRADRRLPGGLAPLRTDAARGRGLALGRLLRRLVRRRRAGVAAGGGLGSEGLLLRRRLARVLLVAPGARRHRLHVGARPAFLPQAGEDQRAALRLRDRAP